MQAYRYTLLFLATGNTVYAKNAVDIIKDWCDTCTIFTGSNAPLECAWGGTAMVRAAELLKWKWVPGWKDSNVETSLRKFVGIIMIPCLMCRYGEISRWNNNWILTIHECLLQIYIFLDDRTNFEWVVSEYRRIAPLTFANVATGKNTECERDIIHAQFQLHSHIQICEMTMHQEIVLYTPLIARSCEYIASIINGKVPSDIQKSSIKDAWFMPGAWEIAFNHYTRRSKLNMPETHAMLSKPKRRPEGMSFNWGPGWPFESSLKK